MDWWDLFFLEFQIKSNHQATTKDQTDCVNISELFNMTKMIKYPASGRLNQKRHQPPMPCHFKMCPYWIVTDQVTWHHYHSSIFFFVDGFCPKCQKFWGKKTSPSILSGVILLMNKLEVDMVKIPWGKKCWKLPNRWPVTMTCSSIVLTIIPIRTSCWGNGGGGGGITRSAHGGTERNSVKSKTPTNSWLRFPSESVGGKKSKQETSKIVVETWGNNK